MILGLIGDLLLALEEVIVWMACTSGYHPRTRWEIVREWQFEDDLMHIQSIGRCPVCYAGVQGQHVMLTREDIRDRLKIEWPVYLTKGLFPCFDVD